MLITEELRPLIFFTDSLFVKFRVMEFRASVVLPPHHLHQLQEE